MKKKNTIAVDIVPDYSVTDDAALLKTLTEELSAAIPGKTFHITVDHNYSD